MEKGTAIKSNELRIGSYFNQFGNIHQATWSTIKTLDLSPPDQLWCLSILITEEILIKSGFKNSQAKNSYYLSIPELKSEVHFERYRGEYVCVIYSSTGSFIPRDIKSLHQLQNLLLTDFGYELEMKLDYEINSCLKCLQITNHLNGICQKCKPKSAE